MALRRPLRAPFNNLLHTFRAGCQTTSRQSYLQLSQVSRRQLNFQTWSSSWSSGPVRPASASTTARHISAYTQRVAFRSFASSTNPRLLHSSTLHRFSQLRLGFSRRQQRRHNSAGPNPTPHLNSPPSLSQRLKKLSREYGWTAVGVYLALSALDFPFCFLAVQWLGTERIGRWEDVILEQVRAAVRFVYPDAWPQKAHAHHEGKDTEVVRKVGDAVGEALPERLGEAVEPEGHFGWTDEVVEAEKANSGSNACKCITFFTFTRPSSIGFFGYNMR